MLDAEPNRYEMAVSAEAICLAITHQQIPKLPPLQKRTPSGSTF
jgi:hypothetical protein